MATLEQQCNFAVKAQPPFLKTDGTGYDADIGGLIEIETDQNKLNIMICFTKKVFLLIMSSMFGRTFDDIVPELEDGAAELVNIIVGQAEQELVVYGFSASLPKILKQQDIAALQKKSDTIIVLPFVNEKGRFYIEIYIDQSRKADIII